MLIVLRNSSRVESHLRGIDLPTTAQRSDQPVLGGRPVLHLPRTGEVRNPLGRDDNGLRLRDALDMEVILSHVEYVRWVFSPLGLVTVLAIAGVLLSGLPGAILPNLQVTASARRAIRRQQPLRLQTTNLYRRERMES